MLHDKPMEELSSTVKSTGCYGGECCIMGLVVEWSPLYMVIFWELGYLRPWEAWADGCDCWVVTRLCELGDKELGPSRIPSRRPTLSWSDTSHLLTNLHR